MSRLAHATYAAPGFEREKREMAVQAQREIAQARVIQRQTGCTWTEALRIASIGTPGAAIAKVTGD